MQKLTIGADPELVLISPLNHQAISAQQVFVPKNNDFVFDCGIML